MIKKKLLFSLIMIATIFALIVPSVFAADNNTITINGNIGGKTMEIYRLLNFDVTNQNYTFTSATSDSDADKDRMTKSQAFFFQTPYAFQYEEGGTTKQATFTKIYEITEWLKKNTNNQSALMAMSEAFYTYAKANGISPVATVDLSGNKTATSYVTDANLKQGYYLVYDTTSDTALSELDTTKSAPMLSVVPLTGTNATVGIKADTITTPGKTVSPETQRVGKEVTFTVTANVPNMIEYDSYVFKFHDKMTTGLDYVPNSTTIKITKTDKPDVILEEGSDKDYTLTYNATTREFEVNMIDFLKWRTQGYNEGTITWTYRAKLNENAVKPGETINSVYTEYSNDPLTNSTGTTEPHNVEVKVYNLELTKVNSEGNILEGATFTLTKQGEGTPIYFDKTTGIVATEDTPDANKTQQITSGSDGVFSFKGLEEGTYNLKEVALSEELAAIYRISAFNMVLKITAEGATLSAPTLEYLNDRMSEQGYVVIGNTKTDTKTQTINGVSITSTKYTFTANVLNTLKDALPSTGGVGTVIFTCVGIAVMIGAVVLFIINKKKNS